MINALLDLLAWYYQMGDLRQTEAIARSLLRAVPDDVVALQFLALALHQRGRFKDAYLFFRTAAERQAGQAGGQDDPTCETAASHCYREATRFGSRLAEGWFRISQVMAYYGFKEPAAQALNAAIAARTDRRRVARRASRCMPAGATPVGA